MPVTIDQITHWTRPWGRGKAGCVVVSDLGGYVVTACNSMRSGDAVTARPEKVCRKCRAALKDLSLNSDSRPPSE